MPKHSAGILGTIAKQTNRPMFFILILASGGISSGSLYKDRQKRFYSTGEH